MVGPLGPGGAGPFNFNENDIFVLGFREEEKIRRKWKKAEDERLEAAEKDRQRREKERRQKAMADAASGEEGGQGGLKRPKL